MPFDPYIQKALLDWVTGAATPVQPTGLFLGFESGSPTSASSSAAPLFRNTVSFQAASTAGGGSASVSLSAIVTCSATANCTLFGWGLFASTSGGQRYMYGTLSATQTMLSGSAAFFGPANLIITLS